MVLDFSLGNYRSFNSIQHIDFRSTPLISPDKDVDVNNIVDINGNKILKVIGIYGPNGSGKTNLINGFNIFRQLVRGSLESESIMDFAASPFKLSSELPENAGFFQIQLLLKNKKYRYGFTLSIGGNVLQEWLFGTAEKNETWYFKRTDQSIDINGEWFSEGNDLPKEKLRSNTLFLTFVSAYDGEISQALRSFIVNKINIDNSNNGRINFRSNTRGVRGQLLNRNNFKTNELLREGKNALVLKWLKDAGLQYSNITLQESNSEVEEVILEKNIFNNEGKIVGQTNMELEEFESTGTKKYYSYIGRLNQIFQEGGIFLSDEIDKNFHPSLLQQLMRFFNDPEINKAGAQLLFTSHDTNLLKPEILRRDQIYFTEKSSTEASILYSLADLKGIRNNADFANQYLSGFYGALPILEMYREQPKTDPYCDTISIL